MIQDFNIDALVRSNIRDLEPYSSARSENLLRDALFMDANESPYNTGYNRYPEPVREQLREAFVKRIKDSGFVTSGDKLSAANVFTGNGSDEAIDILIRIFCEPARDSVLSASPTYGMYKVAARINDVRYTECELEEDFSLDSKKLLSMVDYKTKIVFLCTPNNPTGNLLDKSSVLNIVENFNGIVVVDEAYMDFAGDKGFISLINKYNNLVVLRTMSKALGMASLRVGFALASPLIISYMQRVKYPYNLSKPSQDMAIKALESFDVEKIESITKERDRLASQLNEVDCVKKVYNSDSNFILVQVDDPSGVTDTLKSKGIVIRDRSKVKGCEGCVRITVGTARENDLLLAVLKGDETQRYGPAKEFSRITKETSVNLRLLDESGASTAFVKTGIGFFDHMLDLFMVHSGVYMELTVEGDLETDAHHTIEDTAIVLGEAINYLYTKAGAYNRYGFVLPMDECAAQAVIDLGGRFAFMWDAQFKYQFTGDFPTEMFTHFFYSIASAGKFTLHMNAKGQNDHHIAESLFKAFARALRIALSKNAVGYDGVPSSKGLI